MTDAHRVPAGRRGRPDPCRRSPSLQLEVVPPGAARVIGHAGAGKVLGAAAVGVISSAAVGVIGPAEVGVIRSAAVGVISPAAVAGKVAITRAVAPRPITWTIGLG